MPLMRLDRMLSSQGIGSRKDIKIFLNKKLVTVNGTRIKNASFKADPEKDEILIDGKKFEYSEHIYIMMNKPAGAISASEDPNAETVIDLLPEEFRRPGLFPAGRLDRDTEGFLLITDDGTFAHNILSPKHHVEKEYYAVIDGSLSEDDIKRFETGLDIGEKNLTLPAKLSICDEKLENGNVGVRVIIHEGKFHQIKRMFEALGREVLYLKRTAMGGLSLDENLESSECRLIAPEELSLITSKPEIN